MSQAETRELAEMPLIAAFSTDWRDIDSFNQTCSQLLLQSENSDLASQSNQDMSRHLVIIVNRLSGVQSPTVQASLEQICYIIHGSLKYSSQCVPLLLERITESSDIENTSQLKSIWKASNSLLNITVDVLDSSKLNPDDTNQQVVDCTQRILSMIGSVCESLITVDAKLTVKMLKSLHRLTTNMPEVLKKQSLVSSIVKNILQCASLKSSPNLEDSGVKLVQFLMRILLKIFEAAPHSLHPEILRSIVVEAASIVTCCGSPVSEIFSDLFVQILRDEKLRDEMWTETRAFVCLCDAETSSSITGLLLNLFIQHGWIDERQLHAVHQLADKLFTHNPPHFFSLYSLEREILLIYSTSPQLVEIWLYELVLTDCESANLLASRFIQYISLHQPGFGCHVMKVLLKISDCLSSRQAVYCFNLISRLHESLPSLSNLPTLLPSLAPTLLVVRLIKKLRVDIPPTAFDQSLRSVFSTDTFSSDKLAKAVYLAVPQTDLVDLIGSLVLEYITCCQADLTDPGVGDELCVLLTALQENTAFHSTLCEALHILTDGSDLPLCLLLSLVDSVPKLTGILREELREKVSSLYHRGITYPDPWVSLTSLLSFKLFGLKTPHHDVISSVASVPGMRPTIQSYLLNQTSGLPELWLSVSSLKYCRPMTISAYENGEDDSCKQPKRKRIRGVGHHRSTIDSIRDQLDSLQRAELTEEDYSQLVRTLRCNLEYWSHRDTPD